LESVCAATYREFESHSLRKPALKYSLRSHFGVAGLRFAGNPL